MADHALRHVVGKAVAVEGGDLQGGSWWQEGPKNGSGGAYDSQVCPPIERIVLFDHINNGNYNPHLANLFKPINRSLNYTPSWRFQFLIAFA